MYRQWPETVHVGHNYTFVLVSLIGMPELALCQHVLHGSDTLIFFCITRKMLSSSGVSLRLWRQLYSSCNIAHDALSILT